MTFPGGEKLPRWGVERSPPVGKDSHGGELNHEEPPMGSETMWNPRCRTMSSYLHMSLSSLPRYSGSSGSARSAGGVKLGVWNHPALFLPVGVEPSKPRKLNDDRFLNLW